MMSRIIWTALSVLLCVAIISAQDNCPALDENLLDALENCDNAESGILCYGSGEITIESDAQDNDFTEIGDVALLEDIMSVETVSSDNLSIAIMTLNREDVALRLIAYGDVTVDNQAPRSTISVFALRGVNVRQEPSLDATVIGSLLQGRDYTAVGRLADNTWIQVMLEDGRVGWSSAQYFVAQDGFTELEAVTPNTPPYLPMQSLTLSTGDCSGLLLIAPELDEERIIFGIHGAQVQVNGILWVQASDNNLQLTSITDEHIVDTFGFEMTIAANETTSIPLSDSGTIAGIASEAEIVELELLSEDSIDLLFD